MRALIIILLVTTIYLQYTLWFAAGGVRDVDRLRRALAEQHEQIAQLRDRNRALAAEVQDLKQGLEAIEERARSEMGMIKGDEVFFQISEPEGGFPAVKEALP